LEINYTVRKTSFIALVILSVSLLVPIFVSPVRATTTTAFQWTYKLDYTCNPKDCSSAFSEDGIAHGTFGTMSVIDNGLVTGSPDANGCFTQAITYTFTRLQSNSHDSLVLDTPYNVACPTSDPNVWTVTATFNIIGGTGVFAGAAGSGNIAIVFRVHPQTANEVFTGIITY
jgi:hypothetical protein